MVANACFRVVPSGAAGFSFGCAGASGVRGFASGWATVSTAAGFSCGRSSGLGDFGFSAIEEGPLGGGGWESPAGWGRVVPAVDGVGSAGLCGLVPPGFPESAEGFGFTASLGGTSGGPVRGSAGWAGSLRPSCGAGFTDLGSAGVAAAGGGFGSADATSLPSFFDVTISTTAKSMPRTRAAPASNPSPSQTGFFSADCRRICCNCAS